MTYTWRVWTEYLYPTTSLLTIAVLSKGRTKNVAPRATQAEQPGSALDFPQHDPLKDPTLGPAGIDNVQVPHKGDEPGLMCTRAGQGFKDI